jgi:SAM-dependent methyltransferase
VVTGVDIASNLLAQARQRTAEEGLAITFAEGDAERLAYPDASFDAVVTMYGAMFAPRPALVAAEMLRVCRPGGLMAMANWTPSGFVGQVFAATSRHVPPPAGVPAPVLWGDEATVRERFGSGAKSVSCTRQMAEFDYPFPPREVVDLFRQYFGPTQAAFSNLDAQGQAALAADLTQLWEKHNEGGSGKTFVRAEYLEVRAVRA